MQRNSHQRWLNSLRRTAFAHYFRKHPLMCFLDEYEAESEFDFLHIRAFMHTLRNNLRNGTSPYHFQMSRKHSLGLIAQSQITILVISRLLCHREIKRTFTHTVTSRISFIFFNNLKFLAEQASALFSAGLLELRCNRPLLGAIRNFTLAGIYGCKPAIQQLIRLLEENRLAADFRHGRPDYSKNSEFVQKLESLLLQ
jgi:hypothetical protein